MNLRALTLALALQYALNTSAPEPLPVERYCEGHPVQEAFLADESRVRVLICGRRTGKTVGLIVEAIRTMLAYTHEPDVYVIYITKTAKNAKKQFWKPLKRMLRDSGHKFKSNEQDLVLELDAGGGGLLIAGADDKEQIEKYRGWAFALAIVDECGVYPSGLLETLIDEVLEPATADVGGRIVLAGTPGPTLKGTWYDYSGPAANGPHVHRGTLLDNPHMRRDLPPEERRDALVAWLADMRETKGWSEDHPTYVREWLGRWAQDDNVLVFPIKAANDFPEKDEQGEWRLPNGPFGLPSHTDTGVRLPIADWRVVIGVDVGYTQSNAYSVVATHPALTRSFILRTFKRTEQLIPEMSRELRKLREDYAIHWGGEARLPTVVIDAGGMGKIHAATLSRKLGVPVKAADKREKGSSIATTRDEVMSRVILLLRRDQWGEDPCEALVDEWHVLCWNDDRDGIADDQEDHATDATLYALRELRNYTRKEPPRGPKKGTPEWHALEEEKAIAEMERKAEADHRRSRRRSRRVA